MVKSEELVGLNKIQFWNKQGLVVEKIWLQYMVAWVVFWGQSLINMWRIRAFDRAKEWG